SADHPWHPERARGAVGIGRVGQRLVDAERWGDDIVTPGPRHVGDVRRLGHIFGVHVAQLVDVVEDALEVGSKAFTLAGLKAQVRQRRDSVDPGRGQVWHRACGWPRRRATASVLYGPPAARRVVP